jgi:hypothetical protein
MWCGGGRATLDHPGRAEYVTVVMPRWLLILLPLLLAIGGAAYTGRMIDRGWTPFDEGQLGQSAERVASGELPHRDFDEVYTGGLTELDAMAFRVLGFRLSVLRVVLLVCFTLWIPAVYYVARRWASPGPAAIATILAIVWSVPNYPAAMPSWYNLFLATWALAAALRFIDSGHTRWLFVGGLAAGLSILVKIVGLFALAGILIGLAWGEQTRSEQSPSSPRAWAYSVALTLALAAIVMALYRLVSALGPVSPALYFVVPTAALAGAVVLREWRGRYRPSAERLRTALSWLVPLLAGTAVPIVIFLIPYIAAGAIPDLVRGVIVMPPRRLRFAAYPLPGLAESLPAILALLVVAAAPFVGQRWRVRYLILVAAVLVAGFVSRPPFIVWIALRLTIPVLAVAGAVFLSAPERVRPIDAHAQWRLFLLLSVTSLASLVEFPYSSPVYFCYVAPLAVLSLLAVWQPAGRRVAPVAAMLASFAFLFATIRSNWDPVVKIGHTDIRTNSVPLALPRAGLWVQPDDKVDYEGVIPLVQRHAGASAYVYATPDLPEISFLAGMHNPTRTLYDFFDDTTGRVPRIVHELAAHDVRVVVITSRPAFSPRVSPALDSALTARYPASTTVGRFTVRWIPN